MRAAGQRPRVVDIIILWALQLVPNTDPRLMTTSLRTSVDWGESAE